jgi:transposase
MAVNLGLVPKQHSSGERQILGGISKHGDRYLRQLLIHGGRAALKAALRIDKATGLPLRTDKHSEWMRTLCERRGKNKACVAIANKNARIIVALLKDATPFQAQLAHAKESMF